MKGLGPDVAPDFLGLGVTRAALDQKGVQTAAVLGTLDDTGGFVIAIQGGVDQIDLVGESVGFGEHGTNAIVAIRFSPVGPGSLQAIVDFFRPDAFFAIGPAGSVFRTNKMNTSADEPSPQTPAYGTPEMEALLQEAEASMRRTRELWADAGVTLDEVEAAIDAMPAPIRSEYERLLREDREEAALVWRDERRLLLQRYGVPAETSSSETRAPRTRLRL